MSGHAWGVLPSTGSEPWRCSELAQCGDPVLDGRVRVEQMRPLALARRVSVVLRHRLLDPQVGCGSVVLAHHRAIVPQLLECGDQTGWIAGHLDGRDVGERLPSAT